MIAIVDIGNAIEGRDGAYIVRGGTAGYTRLRTGEFFTFDEMIQHYSRCGGVERSSARRPRNPARPKPAACSVCALAALKPTAEPVDALCGLGGISAAPERKTHQRGSLGSCSPCALQGRFLESGRLHKSFILLARPEGFEPPAPRFVVLCRRRNGG